MVWGMGLLAAGSVVLGIAPQLAVNYLLNPINSALGIAAVQVTWFGLASDAGSFSTAGGLVLAMVSIVLGGVIYAVAYAGRQTPATVAVTAGGAAMASSGGGIFTGGEPLSSEGRLTAGDFSGIFLQNWKEFFRWSNVDRVYLAGWSGLQAVSRALGVAVSWMEQKALVLVIVLAALILAAARWLVPGVMSLPTGTSIQVPQMLVAACGIAAVALILAALSQAKTRQIALCALIVGSLTVAGLIVANPWLRLGLLELGAMLTILRVWNTARTQSAKITYLAVVLISAFTLVASDVLLEHGQADWARAFLLTSICVKLAAVPLFFWLLRLADEVPALVLGLIIAVVDMAAFGELYIAVHASPGLFAPTQALAWHCRRNIVPGRSADAHAAQPEASAGSLHG